MRISRIRLRHCFEGDYKTHGMYLGFVNLLYFYHLTVCLLSFFFSFKLISTARLSSRMFQLYSQQTYVLIIIHFQAQFTHFLIVILS